MRRIRRTFVVCLGTALLALLLARPGHAGWPVAHATPGNAGAVPFRTAPAGAGSLTVPGLGTFAAGAGPVIAEDGTVILGTLEGRVIALRPDGKPAWTRSLQPGSSVLASPAIGTDGSIYVIGAELTGNARTSTSASRLDFYRFSASGEPLAGPVPFPQQPGTVGFTSAFPNIWRTGTTEAIMVPVLYRHPSTAVYKTHLIAFAPTGAVLADVTVSTWVPQTTGSTGCIVFCFSVPQYHDPAFDLPEDTRPPMPGVAVYTFPGGGTPWVIVADGFNDVVGYTFYPAQASFRENFRVHDTSRRMVSPPTMTPQSNSAIGTDKDLIFAGPSGAKLAPIPTGTTYAAPTIMNGRLVTVHSGNLESIPPTDPQARWHYSLQGQSIVSAAASPDYVYVSMANAFYSYRMLPDGKLQEASRIDWFGGGISPPAIGPSGRVYAIASNILFIFPPPKSVTAPLKQVAGTATGQALSGGTKVITGQAVLLPQDQGAATVAQPKTKTLTLLKGQPATALQQQGKAVTLLQPQAETAAKPASQTFQPPLTTSGKRLHACQDLDGTGCGVPVAAAFCQQQGFAQAGKIDTQTLQVPAETLAGQACQKKKCRVFELIVCSN